MLVSELRELLKKYNEEDLRWIISEMYKTMPKKIREDKNIDMLMKNVHSLKNNGKREKTKDVPLNIDHLTLEVEEFLDYAYKQYYLYPNQFVHKKERPKWRFKVKGYIKDLQEIPVARDEDTGIKATELLQKLFEILSYACEYALFNTDNPFKSVGIAQLDLLDIIIKRKLTNEINHEVLKSTIKMVIMSGVDRETLYDDLTQILIMNLKSTDSKMMAIDQCKLLKNEIEKSIPSASRKSWDFSMYKLHEQINNLVRMVFRIQVELFEYDEAINFYNENYFQEDDEIKLYILLSLLLEYKLADHWIKAYESAVKRGIEPREVLQLNYQKIQGL